MSGRAGSAEAAYAALVDAAARRYRPAGRFAQGFARGKLAGDPAFARLLADGLLGDARVVLDLGCGQGLLAALLVEAERAAVAGRWPPGWPAPPRARVRGIELMARDVARARAALAGSAQPAVEIEVGDIATTPFGVADCVVILDVLHYLGSAQQDDVLRRVRSALAANPAGGRLLLRVGDADGGLRFRASVWVDHVVTFCRGHRLARLYCRPVRAWQAALESLGFSVRAEPLAQGTPFANVLLIADCSAGDGR